MSEHRFTIEHLPWLANGTLVGSEKERIERHLGECLTCQQEWRVQRRIAEAVASPSLAGEPAEAFAALDARLDAADTATAGTGAWLSRIVRSTPRPVRVTVAAQFVAVIALVAVLFSMRPPEDTAPYRTRAESGPAAGDARVVFSPQASVADINALLSRHGARVVDGPTRRGVYTLLLAPGAERDTLRALREEPVVVFAERPSGAQSEPP